MRKHLVEDFTGTQSAAKSLSLCLNALRMKPEDISAADLSDLRRWKNINLMIREIESNDISQL
jgi:hypothetical protein